MGKKKKHKNQSKASKWLPPENFLDFFDSSADDEFKAAHPIGYFFLVFFGIAAMLAPAILYSTVVGNIYGWENNWIVLGWAGGFVFGIGLFNFVGIIIKQYLGRLFSIICFSIGSVMMLISWLLCR